MPLTATAEFLCNSIGTMIWIVGVGMFVIGILVGTIASKLLHKIFH